MSGTRFRLMGSGLDGWGRVDVCRGLVRQVFVEEFECALPCELCGGGVVAWCGVVVEAVVCAGVDVRFERDVVCGEGLFVGGGAGHDAAVEFGVLDKQWCFDFGHVGGVGL